MKKNIKLNLTFQIIILNRVFYDGASLPFHFTTINRKKLINHQQQQQKHHNNNKEADRNNFFFLIRIFIVRFFVCMSFAQQLTVQTKLPCLLHYYITRK